jgi:hypothetical protein
MCRKLILLLIVFAVVAGFSGIASAALIQIPVNRSGGATDNRAPIGAYDGERDPEPTQQGHWQVGNYMFSDRTFTWASVAPQLEDAEQVRTYNSDKGASGVTYTVTFPVGATALVAVDDRFGDQQTYVNNVVSRFAAAGTFTDTGWNVVNSEGTPQTLSLFSAVLNPGTYVFGAGQNSNNFYVIGALPPPALPKKATQPIPTDKARTPPTGPSGTGYYMLMQFTPGDTATSHTAYFSSKFDDVNDRNPAFRLGSPPYPVMYPTGYYVGLDVPELPAFARVPLRRGTIYYWAVDESNGVGSYPGDVWSFTIASQQAWDPTPLNGDQLVNADPDVALSWKLGDVDATGKTVSYDVYYGTVFADVNTSTTPTVHVTTTSAVTGSLLGNTVYYWRVDTVLTQLAPPFTSTKVKGDVWNFKTLPVVAITDPDLVGWWKLDGDIVPAIAFDSSGHANHGTLRGDPEYVPGQVDNAMDFDGDDYADCGNSPQLDFGTGDWSVCAWVKPTLTTDTRTVFAKGGDEGGGIRYALALGEAGDDGSVTLTTDDNVTKVQATSTRVVSNNEWHHVVGQRAGDAIGVFVDAIPDGTTALPAGYNLAGTSQHNACIAAITDHTDLSGATLLKFLVGSVADLRIYDYALTQGQIITAAGLARWHIPVPSAAELYEGEAEGSRVINFRDYAVLTDRWLEEELYP